jgi:hypothetical protein
MGLVFKHNAAKREVTKLILEDDEFPGVTLLSRLAHHDIFHRKEDVRCPGQRGSGR